MTEQELNAIKARWLPEFEKGSSLVADIWDLFQFIDKLKAEIESLKLKETK